MDDSLVRTRCWKISYLPPHSAQTCADSDPKAALSARAVGADKFPSSNHSPRGFREIFGISKSGMVKPEIQKPGRKKLGKTEFATFPSYP